MSTIQVAKNGMGFQSASQRPSCKNCYHLEQQTAERMPPFDTKTWYCKSGGFFTTAMATCNRHQPWQRDPA